MPKKKSLLRSLIKGAKHLAPVAGMLVGAAFPAAKPALNILGDLYRGLVQDRSPRIDNPTFGYQETPRHKVTRNVDMLRKFHTNHSKRVKEIEIPDPITMSGPFNTGSLMPGHPPARPHERIVTKKIKPARRDTPKIASELKMRPLPKLDREPQLEREAVNVKIIETSKPKRKRKPKREVAVVV